MIIKQFILISLFCLISSEQNEHFKTNIVAKLGQKVKLPCFVENGHKFIWMKSDQDEVISIGEIVMINQQSFSVKTECDKTEYNFGLGCWVHLIIDNLELTDEGVYVCQKDTMLSSYINLTILGIN